MALERLTKPQPLEIPIRVQQVLARMEAFGREQPRMRNVTRELGHLLYFMVCNISAKHVVEVGTSNGYSTIWLALAGEKTSGYITSFENQEWKANLALSNLAEAGLLSKVTIVINKDLRDLKNISEPIDMMFMDILPEDYLQALSYAQGKLKPGSVIVCDNFLGHRDREGTITPRGQEGDDYLKYAATNFYFSSPLLSIGSGVHIGILKG